MSVSSWRVTGLPTPALPLPLHQSHGTKVDKKAIPTNKPVALRNGARIQFGSCPAVFTVRCESSAEKRKSDTSAMSGDKVRASHILVKHEFSRRPSSWKVRVSSIPRGMFGQDSNVLGWLLLLSHDSLPSPFQRKAGVRACTHLEPPESQQAILCHSWLSSMRLRPSNKCPNRGRLLRMLMICS